MSTPAYYESREEIFDSCVNKVDFKVKLKPHTLSYLPAPISTKLYNISQYNIFSSFIIEMYFILQGLLLPSAASPT